MVAVLTPSDRCPLLGCGKPFEHGFCPAHPPEVCIECGRKIHGKGRCPTHYKYYWRTVLNPEGYRAQEERKVARAAERRRAARAAERERARVLPVPAGG